MLEAYFDDGGTHGQAAVTVIAGWVGTKDAWVEFERKARELLEPVADKGVRFFHMSEMLMQDGQYKLVDRPAINYLITQMADLLNDLSNDLFPLYSGVLTSDWRSAVTDSAFLDRFPGPIDLCFDDIIRQLWKWGVRKARGEKIAPMFAKGNSSEKRMGEVGRLYDKEEWYQRILGPIAFGAMQEVMPLWSADFIAHQMSGEIGRSNYQPLNMAEGGGTRALWKATPRGKVGHYFDAPGLRLTIERFKKTGEIYETDPAISRGLSWPSSPGRSS